MTSLYARIFGLLAVSLVLAGAVGCSEPLPESKSQYAGVWRGGTMYLEIQPGGTINYQRREGSMNTELNGIPIKRFGDGYFVAGVGPADTKFVIDEPPHQDEDGRWRMTVDGVELTRQE